MVSSAGTNRPPVSFGVLAASGDPERLSAERAAGVDVVELDLAWDRYQPTPETVDTEYVEDLRSKLAACRSAKMRITLSAGLQYPPDWVRALPGGTFIDQHGRRPASEPVDVVYSAAVRDAVAAYYRRIASDIDFAQVVAFRLGTTDTGELGYPGPNDAPGSDDNSYWAFSDAAQDGTGLAAGMLPSPMPGWLPGSPDWANHPVEERQMTMWFVWYTNSLVAAVEWQAWTLRAVGFRGRFHVPVAGRGGLPNNVRAAIAGRLDGRNDPDRALARGLYYPDQFRSIADVDRRLRERSGTGIDVDYTGVDDDTAVQARRLDSPQDSCRADDLEAMTRAAVDVWSGQRWTIANARRAGLRVLGENPGPPGLPFTGGSAHSDTEAEQLVNAVAYARRCGLHTFLFAFESDLFDDYSGISVEDYAHQIAADERADR